MNYDLIFHVDSRDDFDMKLALSEAANYRNESVRQERRVDPDDIIAIGSSSSSLMPIPFSIVFVITGPAVKFINRDNTDLLARAQEAYDNGVQFFADGDRLAGHDATGDFEQLDEDEFSDYDV